MFIFKIIIISIFSYSTLNAQVFNIDKKWNLLGMIEDINDLNIFKSTCVDSIFTYSQDKAWISYPKDDGFNSISAGNGFWAHASENCVIDTKSSANSNGVLDITNSILTNKSANCSDYVKKYGSSVLDIKNNQNFKAVFEIYIDGDKCVFKSNSIANHDFNDNSARFATKVSEQDTRLEITSSPTVASNLTYLSLGENGIMLNGVKLDILPAGCFGVGDGKIGCFDNNSPWRYDPMSPNAKFGTDKHNAHTQPTGTYHYHGSPEALFDTSGNIESPVIGFAIDGFPIFGSYFKQNNKIIKATSSYKIKEGARQDVNGINPGGNHDGTFRDDYEYVKGAGHLDECNGMSIDGVYGYYVTDTFPWVINCYKGIAPERKQGPSPKDRR